MSASLAAIATSLETAAGASTSANANESGYWKRAAAASETLAGASTTANEHWIGYMKRTAVALESIAGTSGAEENTNEAGYMKRIVDALEVQAGAVTEGSLMGRLVTAAANATFGGGDPTIDADTTFETTTGWTDTDGGGSANMAISGGVLISTGGTGATLEIMSANILNCPAPGSVINLQYEITASDNPGSLRVQISIGDPGVYISSSSAVGVQSTSITVGAVDTILRIRGGGSAGTNWSMTSITIVGS